MFSTTMAGLTVCCACWMPCKPAKNHCWNRPAVVHYAAPMIVEVKPAETKEAPAAKAKSLYERLGGEPAIKAVVDDFVARAAANPKVNFTRKGTNKEWKPTPEGIDHLKKMLVDLVGMVSGGPQKYTGRSMKDAHAGMMISEDEFNALAADLKASLDKFKVPAKEQGELLKVVAGTAGDIVEKKGKK